MHNLHGLALCKTCSKWRVHFCGHIFILWFYIDGHIGFVYVSYCFFPRALPLRRSHLWRKGKYVLLSLGRHDQPRSEIYPLWHNHTLARIMMISQRQRWQDGIICCMLLDLYHDDRPRSILLLLNIFAPWLVSWWSAKAKCQDGAIWRMLLGLYHNDQPKDKFSSLKYKCSLACITMINQGKKITRRNYMLYAPWFVSQWSANEYFCCC